MLQHARGLVASASHPGQSLCQLDLTLLGLCIGYRSSANATKHLQQITCHSALTSQPVLQCLLSWRRENWSLGNWSVKRDYEGRMAVVSVERMALSSSGTPSLMSQCVAVG